MPFDVWTLMGAEGTTYHVGPDAPGEEVSFWGPCDLVLLLLLPFVYTTHTQSFNGLFPGQSGVDR